MGELKKIRVRRAKSRDIGLFKKLWMGLLEQRVKEGSIVAASEQTMNFYENLFNFYVENKSKGIVLFVADKGVLMWGDTSSLLDFPGKPITDWGIYSESELSNEIDEALFKQAIEWSKKQGFNGILTEKYIDPKLGEDEFKTVINVMYKDLND